MPHYVYILKCADSTLYIGSTNDLKERLHAHNKLKSGAHYTRTRRPVTLVYSERFDTVNEALKREYEMKQLTRSAKLALIKGKTSPALHPQHS